MTPVAASELDFASTATIIIAGIDTVRLGPGAAPANKIMFAGHQNSTRLTSGAAILVAKRHTMPVMSVSYTHLTLPTNR